MKILVIAEDENKLISLAEKIEGGIVMRYDSLIKALDNLCEICPDVILLSAVDYPMHWKLLAAYARSPLLAIFPLIFIAHDSDFTPEEEKKAMALGVKYFFWDGDPDTAEHFIKRELAVSSRTARPMVFTHPFSRIFIFGLVFRVSANDYLFTARSPILPVLPAGRLITEASVSWDGLITGLTLRVVSSRALAFRFRIE